MKCSKHLAAGLVVFAASTGFAWAQSGASDALHALITGDEVTAARLLKERVDSSDVDPVALFFRAAMLQSGAGEPADPIRACGLYLKSAASPSNPLAPQAAALARSIHVDIPKIIEVCSTPPQSLPPARGPTRALQSNTPDSANGAMVAASDALNAIIRGDYGHAADVLKPVAERSPSNQAATFLMAVMYQNGLGVATDEGRALALYMQTMNGAESAFRRIATELWQQRWMSRSSATRIEIAAMSNIGLDHGFQPATFTLGPQHWVSFDLGTASATFGGVTKTIDHGLAQPGSVFLPLQNTELPAGARRNESRHFVEAFQWQQLAVRSSPVVTLDRQFSTPQPTWALLWTVFEVVGADVIAVTRQTLTRVQSVDPPGASQVDVRALARLQVRPDGAVEWSVRDGDQTHSEYIESPVDRAETARLARERTDADARVDWKAVRDVARMPLLAYVDASGCGNVLVYGWSVDRAEAIVMRIRRDLANTSGPPQELDLARNPGTVTIHVDVFSRSQRQWSYCSDMQIHREEPGEAWRAIGGKLTIETSDSTDPRGRPVRMATVRLIDAEFSTASGRRIKQLQPIILRPWLRVQQ